MPAVIDVLLVSHLLNKSQLRDIDDFYYGALSKHLHNKGLKSALLLLNQSGIDDISIYGQWNNLAPRIIFDGILSFSEEMRLRRDLGIESKRLRKLSHSFSDADYKNICILSSQEALGSLSIANLRMYYQMISLIKRLKPKSILVTYEGHAWERMVFAAARSVDSKILCAGYQHTILFPGQHAIKRSLGAALDPNIVIGAGKGSIEALTDGCNLNASRFVVGGTHRFNEELIAKPSNFSKKNQPICLVIPEGLVDECLLIFRFALEAAGLNKDIKFIFRMHPVLSFEQLTKIDSKLSKLPANVELSNEKIDADLNKSHWALYRGSSAVIHALSHGLRPIYLAAPDELSIDPLHKVGGWRLVVTSPYELRQCIKSDLNKNNTLLFEEAKSSIDYGRNYFSKIDYEVISRELMA